jgi:hypothetical protein
VSVGLYSGVSGLALGTGLYKNVSGLWSGASGLDAGFGGGSPFGGASLYLDFLAGAPLDSRVTFTRGSNATLVDSTGKITYAPANLLLQSQTFDNASWFKLAATVAADAAIAPDGTSTADKLVATAVAGFHGTAINANVTSGVSYILTFYVKAAEYSKFYIAEGNSGAYSCAYDLAAGTAGTPGGTYTDKSASITNVGNGWYRCQLKFTATVTQTSAVSVMGYPNTGATLNNFGAQYTGNGTSGIFIWGAQLEPVTYQTTPSTYVATTSAAYYGPRFDYDPVTLAAKGLLIEEQRVNLVLYSSDFTNATWTKSLSAMAGTFTTAPDGTNTGAKWREDVTLAEHQIYASPSLTAALHTETWYLKAAERTKVRVSLATAGLALGASVIADLSAGTLSAVTNLGIHTGATATISAAGNGWYRVSLTITATATTYYSALTMVTGTNTVLYLGDGTSGIFIWGAQLEAGAFATSYIPTVASTVTRSADVASMTGTNFSSWYNQTEGTFVWAGSPFNVTTPITGLFSANDGTTNNRIDFRNNTDALVTAGGVGQALLTTPLLTVNLINKVAMAVKLNDFAAVSNGGSVATDLAGTMPTVTRLLIGALDAGANYFNGHVRSIAYYNTRLPNAQLQTLTAPSLATTLTMSFTNQAYTVGV